MHFAPNEVQVRELQKFLHNTKDKHEHARALALLMRSEGMAAEKVSDTLHVCVDSIFRWSRAYMKDGIDGISRKKPTGRPPAVKNQAMRVLPKLLKQDPQAFGYLKGRWVSRDIADALKEEGVDTTYSYVCRMLKELGFAYKRPKLAVKSNDPSYARKERQVRNYKKASAALAKKGYW